jgi:hypothetical protein
MTGEIFRFQIPNWALIIILIFSPNQAIGGGIDWINPPSPGPANWMVGEQQNLSWHTIDEYLYLSNISLVQEPPGGKLENETLYSSALYAANCWTCLPSGVVIYGDIPVLLVF